MIIADGWDVMDIQGGLQAYKGMSSAVEVYVRGSGMKDGEQYAISLAGADHLENDLFTGMMESIIFK